jgi:hypothetical protein
MIIVVTGSRFATEGEHGPVIRQTLLWIAKAAAPGLPWLWEGSADGVDVLCRGIGRGLGWKIRSFAANWPQCDPDWVDPTDRAEPCPKWPGIQKIGHRRRRRNGNEYCPIAGFRRNQLMIDCARQEDLHRKICVAFPIPVFGSRGTEDCLTRAWKAGIPTFIKPLETLASTP